MTNEEKEKYIEVMKRLLQSSVETKIQEFVSTLEEAISNKVSGIIKAEIAKLELNLSDDPIGGTTVKVSYKEN